MTYIMTFAGSVPADKKEEYQLTSRTVAEVFKEYGAIRVVECWGDEVPEGEVTSYPKAVKAAEGEVVVTGWQEWPDKETQQAGMQKAMQDPRMAKMANMPINGKHMIFGGFEAFFEI